jgi:tetratricopeptide (TPR) repeat protein
MSMAARRALTFYDYPLAGRLAKAAINAGAGFDASLVQAGSTIGQGQFGRAEEMLAGLQGLAGTDAQRSQAAVTRAENLFWHLGRPAEAQEAISQAEGIVGEQTWRDELLTTRARFLVFEGQVQEALVTALRVLDRPGASDGAQLRAAIDATWALIMAGRTDNACALIDRMESLTAARTSAFPDTYGLTADRWIADLFAGRLAAAAAGLTAWCYQEAKKGPHPLRGVYALFLGLIARTRGQIITASRWLREAAEISRDVDLFATLGNALAELARCQALLGQPSAAEATLCQAQAATPRTSPSEASWSKEPAPGSQRPRARSPRVLSWPCALPASPEHTGWSSTRPRRCTTRPAWARRNTPPPT